MSAGFRSRWLEWTPDAPPDPPGPPPPHTPTKPTKALSVGFVGALPRLMPTNRMPAEDPAPLVCYTCHGTDFWAGTGKVTCRRCHPPAPGAEVTP